MLKKTELDLSEHFQEPLFQIMAQVAQEQQVPAYVVGGFVRDLLLKRPSKDVDVVVEGDGIAFAEKVHQATGGQGNLSIFKNFMTANLRVLDWEVEFVGARKESYRRDSRKPIVEEATLEEDLQRRDFTINALALSLNEKDFGSVIDLFNGLKDLNRQLIRTPLDPQVTFSDDPLRMMRAVRFSTQLQFALVNEVYDAIEENRERINIISAERVSDELNKIILSPMPSIGFKLLFNTQLLHLIFPEMVELQGVETRNGMSHKDNFYHTLQVLDNTAEMTDNLWLRWSAILHDIGKPISQRFDPEQGWTFHGHEVVGERMVPKIFRRMRLPQNEKMKYVKKLVALHLRPIALANEQVTDTGLRRLIVEAGDDIEDLFTLCRADITSKNELKVERYLKRFENVWKRLKRVEEKDKMRNWKNPITGDIIMKTFEMKPGPMVGEMKEEVRNAILNGDIANDYDAAFQFLLEKGQERGLARKSS